jgi:ABC-type uncharacterized transport system substrate-binding protein
MKQTSKAIAFIAILLTFCPSLNAQEAKRLHRIGFLLTGRTESSDSQAVLRRLREFGYVEGQNTSIERSDKASELVGRKVDVIVVFGTSGALEARKATSTVPIVMASSANPVSNGLIVSLGRPGGNVTGLTSLSGELGGKRLEVLKEIVPTLSRVIIPAPAASPTEDAFIKDTELSARPLKLQLIRFRVRGPEEYEDIFRNAKKERADGLLLRLPVAMTPSAQRRRLAELAEINRLPAIYESSAFVDDGGLIAYGTDRNMRYQKVAVYVDKILKGAKPADLPVEQPTKFELVINLKTAKQIGLTIPPNVLARADRVIK